MGPHHHGAHLAHGRLRRRVRRLRRHAHARVPHRVRGRAVLGVLLWHHDSAFPVFGINLHLCEPRVRQAARLHRRLADAVAVLGEPGHGVPHRRYRHPQYAARCADSGSVLRVPHHCGHRVAYRHEDRHGGEQSGACGSAGDSRAVRCVRCGLRRAASREREFLADQPVQPRQVRVRRHHVRCVAGCDVLRGLRRHRHADPRGEGPQARAVARHDGDGHSAVRAVRAAVLHRHLHRSVRRGLCRRYR